MVQLALIDPGLTTATDWQAAAQRRADVRIVDAATADAVVVARLSDVTRALTDGQHVLLCPSAVTSVADAEGLATSDGPIVMLASVDRFSPSIEQIHTCIVGGQLGNPGLLRIHRWLPDTGNMDSVRLVAEFDLANWLFGSLPCDVYAVHRGGSGAYAHAHLGFPNGSMALIDVAITLPEGDDYFSLSVIGGDGSAYADDHHNMHLVYGGGQPTAHRSGEGVTGLVNLLGEFVAAIDESRPALPGPAEARAAQLVAEAARQSIDAGRPLALAETGDAYELA